MTMHLNQKVRAHFTFIDLDVQTLCPMWNLNLIPSQRSTSLKIFLLHFHGFPVSCLVQQIQRHSGLWLAALGLCPCVINIRLDAQLVQELMYWKTALLEEEQCTLPCIHIQVHICRQYTYTDYLFIRATCKRDIRPNKWHLWSFLY